MKDISKSELASILDKYDEDLGGRQKAAHKSKTEDEIFLSEFQRVRKELIRPIMEQHGNELKARGHDYEIEENEERAGEEGTISASIVMRVYLKDIDRIEFAKTPYEKPNVGFVATTYSKKVWTHSSNIAPGRGGSSGPSAEYEISQIVPETVQREVMRGLTHIFTRSW